MDTKQRSTPETKQRSTQSNSAGKADAASGANRTGTTAARKKRTPASQPRQARTAPGQRRTAPKKETAVAARTPRQAAQPRPPRRRPAPEIVYVPPKPFSRNRLLLQLATIVAVVLALTFGISVFFKVSTITVSGMEKYTAWDVREASGIQEGDNLLSFGKARARARILAALPYVENVRVGIKLPDTVNIWVEELDVVYSIRDQSGAWWLITATGEVVEQVDSATAGQYTKILGVLLSLPRVGEQAVAMEPVASAAANGAGQTDETQVTVPVTVFASEQLDAALRILQYLEANSVIGEVATVDVTDLSQIELWYGQQYQVKLGDTSQLSYKISCMKETVDELGSYQSGELDISFTYWPSGVGYTPFS